MTTWLEPAGPVQVREKIQRSLFIARLEPCRSSSEARDFLSRVRAECHDATHNCWAYVVVPDEPTESARATAEPPCPSENSSDDGEPSGTAGRPILGALKRAGLTNAMIIVTRYFGGVKLGVRGLIEAYGGVAARAAEAAETVERVPSRSVSLRVPWGAMGDVTRLLKPLVGGCALQWSYEGDSAVVTADVPLSSLGELDGEKFRFVIEKQIS